VKKIILNFRAICSLGTLSLFILFLAASQPHRVHHFFEDLRLSSKGHVHSHPADHHHDRASEAADGASPAPLHTSAPKHDANHDTSSQTTCVVQAAAHHAHLAALTCTVIPFSSTELTSRAVYIVSSPACFNPSPFSQRAPPSL
jgi:hypothetical protein